MRRRANVHQRVDAQLQGNLRELERIYAELESPLLAELMSPMMESARRHVEASQQTTRAAAAIIRTRNRQTAFITVLGVTLAAMAFWGRPFETLSAVLCMTFSVSLLILHARNRFVRERQGCDVCARRYPVPVWLSGEPIPAWWDLRLWQPAPAYACIEHFPQVYRSLELHEELSLTRSQPPAPS